MLLVKEQNKYELLLINHRRNKTCKCKSGVLGRKWSGMCGEAKGYFGRIKNLQAALYLSGNSCSQTLLSFVAVYVEAFKAYQAKQQKSALGAHYAKAQPPSFKSAKEAVGLRVWTKEVKGILGLNGSNCKVNYFFEV